MGTLLLLGLSAMCAVLPMLSYLLVMWWLDHYEREPLWLVSLTFLWGAVGAVFLALIGNFIGLVGLSVAFGPEAAAVAAPVVVAPLIEEPTKALILFLVARSRAFDNMTDGFVYGAAAGLGFGMTENFFYFSDVGSSGDLGSWAGTVVVRTLYSALMHAGASSCVGAALGWSRGRGALATTGAVIFGFAVAIGMHALWNGLLTWDAVAELNGRLTFVNLLVFPLEFLALVVVYQACIFGERRLILAELGEEAQLGFLPAAHVPLLAGALSRGRPGWLTRGVPQPAYVRAATRLAFRKRQARRGSKREAQRASEEIARLRAEIAGLLALGGR